MQQLQNTQKEKLLGSAVHLGFGATLQFQVGQGKQLHENWVLEISDPGHFGPGSG